MSLPVAFGIYPIFNYRRNLISFIILNIKENQARLVFLAQARKIKSETDPCTEEKGKMLNGNYAII